MIMHGKFWFHDTVSAIAYTFANKFAQSSPHTTFQPPYNDVTRFLLRQHARMPDYLRFPITLATIGFDLAAVGVTGKLFHHLQPTDRQMILARWTGAGLAFKRDLIRFYESLAILALFERSYGTDPVRVAAPEQTIQPHLIHTPPNSVRVEIAVIGSGPAGAITAAILAEHGRDVLLIEEGPFLPLESCPAFSRIEMEQKYRNGGLTVAFGQTKIAYVEACCVGGGSEINSGLYHRTPPEILDEWRKKFHVDGLTERDLLPHFEACENDLAISKLQSAPPPASVKLYEGATRLGWHAIEVPRWFKPQPTPEAPWHGIRQSMTKTYLPRFFGAGGKLLVNTRAVRLTLRNNRCCVEAVHKNGRKVQIDADVVFVCAGAIQSAALLRRSGLKRNIGNTLYVHPTLKVVAEFAEPVNTLNMGVPVHQVKEFAPRISFGCSISSPSYIALGLIDHPNQLPRVVTDWERMANYYAMIVPQGCGSIRPIQGFRDPIVRYKLTKVDYSNLADGLRKLSELLLAAGAVAIYPCLPCCKPIRRGADLTDLPTELSPRFTNLMTIHLFSSCPMGENKSLCAVNSFGQVHGFNNLFVNDASLLCSPPGVNPQGTVMALARRNALKFLNKL